MHFPGSSKSRKSNSDWIVNKLEPQCSGLNHDSLGLTPLYINSIPSYFTSPILASGKIIRPSSVKAVIYVAIFPASSSDLSARMIWSSVLGTNLKEEKPWVGLCGPTRLTLMSVKSAKQLRTRLVPRRSSAVSS